MKNLMSFLNPYDEVMVDAFSIRKGKMPKTGGGGFPFEKKLSAKQRRLNLKKGGYSVKTVYGAMGHGSWWW